MADALIIDVPVKLGLQLMAIIGPDFLDAERELFDDVIDKVDHVGLCVFVVDLVCPETLRNALQLTFFHVVARIGYVEVSVVVCNGDNGETLCPQSRDDFAVEFAPEQRVLIRRPFVQNKDWFFLQLGRYHCNAFSLAARHVSIGIAHVLDADFLGNLHRFQQAMGLTARKRCSAMEGLEQVIV